MVKEFEQVALTVDLHDEGLMAGDVGTVVDVASTGMVVTLEFFNFAGETVAVLPVNIHQIRSLGADEVLHTRVVKSA
jgi:hypothetical protein